MNILYHTTRLPLPADTGGKIRTLNILKQLAKHNRITLLCFNFEETDLVHTKALEDLGMDVQMAPAPLPSFMEIVGAVVFHPWPVSILKYHTSAMRSMIRKVLAKQSFDAVHVDHLHMAVYKDCFQNIPCFLDEHNVEHKILERCAKVEKSWLKKALYIDQSQKMSVFESQRVKEFNGVFTCSEDDRKTLLELAGPGVKAHVVPNGVDTEYFCSTADNDKKDDILVFTGSMDWLPNEDAIAYFCKEILPLVWAQNRDLKLYVVGKSPSAMLKEMFKQDLRVIVTGRVDDVRPFVANAKVFIVPLRIGGGTRLKILEAMAMSKAVVSTTVGAEGIECQDGVNIAIADTPRDFAQKIVDLCRDKTEVLRLGLAGRDLVCQKYDWAIVGKTLNSIYQEKAYASK